YPVTQLLNERGRVTVGSLPAQHDKRKHRLTLDLVRLTDDGGLRNARMRDERRLDLHRTQAVPGNIEHIVDAPHDPVVTVLVTVGAVAGDVITLFEHFPIGGNITVVVAP